MNPAIDIDYQRLERICINCGEFFGRHKASTDECPLVEDKRTIGYMEHSTFKEWKE